MQDGKPARTALPEDPDHLKIFHMLQLLTSKPVLYVCNVSEDEYTSESSENFKKVQEFAKAENNQALMICSQMEAEIIELDAEEREEFLKDMGVEEPGLNRLIRAAYELLGLITYFTAGQKEVRAWTISRNMKAPQAAGKIHSDFEKGFIRAEVYHCEDLFSLKTETAIKDAGKYRSEGKEYVVKDGDVMLFRFNV